MLGGFVHLNGRKPAIRSSTKAKFSGRKPQAHCDPGASALLILATSRLTA